MNRRHVRWADGFIVALQLALSMTALVVSQVLRRVWPTGSATISSVSVILGWLSLPLMLWIGYRLWRLSRDTPGSRSLLAAFAAEVAAAPLAAIGLALAMGVSSHADVGLGVAIAFVAYAGLWPLLASAAAALAAVGLLRSRLAPAWVGWVAAVRAGAISVAALSALFLPVVMQVHRFPGTPFFSVGTAAEVAALFLEPIYIGALGVTVFWSRTDI
jgi:hypothetical protein